MRQAYQDRQSRIGYVWRPALVYGLTYTVFALATKLASPLAGLEPTVFVAAFALGALPGLALAVRGGVRRRRRSAGPPVTLSAFNLISGFATLMIVATTVMAYLFDGVSILLALVLMRLGVLGIAPFLDVWAGRRVRFAAWVAFGICFCGALTGVLSGTFEPMSAASLVVLCLYLTGYGVRLSLMTAHTKTRNRAMRGDWFIVEMSVTLVGLALAGLAALVLSVDRFETVDFRLVGTACLAGIAYGQALVHGTLIYLDWRENAFSITVNRSSSLLAGLAASLAGSMLFGMTWPAMGEWILATLTALALLVLGFDTFRQLTRSSAHRSASCSGR